MLLSDYTNEYASLCITLKKCKEYIDEAQALIDIYVSENTKYINHYFSSDSSSKNSDLGNEVISYTKMIYQRVRFLNQKSIPFLMTLGEIKSLKLENQLLKENADNFYSLAYSSTKIISDIIVVEIDGIRKKNYIHELITVLFEVIQLYNKLLEINSHFLYIEDKLLEPIPENFSDIKMDVLELRSFKHNITFSEFATDISLLSSFMERLDIILSKKEDYTPIFTRKIETGSLRIVWNGTTIEIACVSDIIRAITEAIRTFRLVPPMRALKNEEARSLKLDNDSKALSIINTQIDEISNKLGLDPSNAEDRETIQKLCLPLVKYINNNPVGSVGDIKYNLSHEIKLLEDTYFKSDN